MTYAALRTLALQLLAVAGPAAVVLYLALRAGLLPDNDYWVAMFDVIGRDGLVTEISAWLRPQNEHFLILTRLIYAANILLTGGSNTGLALWAWFAALLQAMLVLGQVNGLAGLRAPERVLLAALAGLFLFTPMAWHNWLLGMSGAAWITANLFVVLALTALMLAQRRDSLPWLLAAIAAGLLATLTYSTGIAVWPALLLGALLLRLPIGRTALIGLAGSMVALAYLGEYSRPTGHPELQSSPWGMLDYLLLYLGSGLTSASVAARALGAAGIGLGTWMSWLALRGRRPFRAQAAFWLALAAYALATGAMAAVARSGFGPEQALSSRYASLPALFWLSLAVLFLLWTGPARRRAGLVLVSAAGLAAAVSVYGTSLAPIARALERADRKALAAAAIYTGSYDLPLLRDTVSIAPRQVTAFFRHREVAGGMRRLGHLPFGRLFAGCPELGASVPERDAAPDPASPRLPGHLDGVTARGGGAFHVTGWAAVDPDEIACIGIFNARGELKGVALPGFPRPDVPRALEQIDNPRLGWEGYARLTPSEGPVSARVRLKSDGTWRRLRGELALR